MYIPTIFKRNYKYFYLNNYTAINHEQKINGESKKIYGTHLDQKNLNSYVIVVKTNIEIICCSDYFKSSEEFDKVNK